MKRAMLGTSKTPIKYVTNHLRFPAIEGNACDIKNKFDYRMKLNILLILLSFLPFLLSYQSYSIPHIGELNVIKQRQQNEIFDIGNDTLKFSNGKEIILKPFAWNWKDSHLSKLNLSFLLDKPAGKDGFVTVKDGHFVKPTGERFKIWGVNLVFGACFPSKEDAPKVVAYLSRFGINAVRFHHFDSRQRASIFDVDGNTTRVFSKEQLDKLDYFIYELKNAGIYSNFNLNTFRSYKEGDDVPEWEYLGIAKGVTLFNEHIIELQKEFAKNLLTHVNPYTGNAYFDEPALVQVEIVNENSLVEAWLNGRLLGEKTTPGGGSWQDIPPYYGKELTQKYNVWLNKNLNPDELASIAKESGVKMGEEIPRLTPKEFKEASKLRFHSEARFLIKTEEDFYLEMLAYLKNELGVKSIIAANSDHSHWSWDGYSLVSKTSVADVVDGHAYWHYYRNSIDPKTGKEPYGRKDNIPMVTMPEISNMAKLARSAVEGKPFTVSEINNGSYNDWYSEGVPLTAAYASLQDWDGIYYFALAHVGPEVWETFKPGGLDLVIDPIRMANMAASGLMFMRGDLKPSTSTVLRGYTKTEMIEGIRGRNDDIPFFTPGFSPLIPLIQKTRIASFEKQLSNFPKIINKTRLEAETGEILWNNDRNNSYVEVASPKSEALIGFLPQETLKLRHLKGDFKNDFASITLSSLDDKPIADSNLMLLITTARAGMSGDKWTIDQTQIIEKGSPPMTIEVVEGKVTLTDLSKAKRVVIEPLDGGGIPLRSITKKVKAGTAIFDIGNDVTVWYLITVKR
jgi:hypothetical protein